MQQPWPWMREVVAVATFAVGAVDALAFGLVIAFTPIPLWLQALVLLILLFLSLVCLPSALGRKPFNQREEQS